MSSLKVGLFYAKGSEDFPDNHVTSNKYGFDSEGSGPLFGYSVDDVVDLGLDPMVTELPSDSSDNINSVIMIDDNSTVDQTLMRFIEYISTTITIDSDNTTVNTTLENQYTDYVPDSFFFKKSTVLPTRVGYIGFKYNIDDVETVFNIYFVPDDLIIRYGLDISRTSVFDTEDLTDGTPVSDTDFSTIITERLIQFEREHNYDYAIPFTTTKVKDTPDGDVQYQKLFFVLSHLNPNETAIDTEKIETIIKNFLILKYNADFIMLTAMYPDLFYGANVSIYPMGTNKQFNLVVLPVTITDINEELDLRGITNGRESAEFFILEGLSPLDNTDYTSNINSTVRVPLLAIEEDVKTPLPPISSRYPEWRIRYTGINSTGRKWEELHIYLKNALQITLNIVDGTIFSSGDPMDSFGFPDHLDFKVIMGEDSRGNEYVDYVSFKFNGTSYKVHGYHKSGVSNG